MKIQKNYFREKGRFTILSWYENIDFNKLKDIRQVYGICFDEKDKILIIKTTKNWQLPGGKPEKEETFEQTLRREVIEEGDVEIDSIIPIGYNKIEDKQKGKTENFYQLRYIAKITKIKKQTIDPATGIISERKFIYPREFLNFCPWGKTGKAMMDKAVKTYQYFR